MQTTSYNSVLDSTKRVVDLSTHVTIDHAKIRAICNATSILAFPHWFDAAPVDLNTLAPVQRLSFLFLFNALSFRYWGEPKWTVQYHGSAYDGSWGMIAAIARAHEGGVPILDPTSWARISETSARDIFSGNILIPNFQVRLDIIRELGDQLRNHYDGDISRLFIRGDNDALLITDLIVNIFHSFDDQADFHGLIVQFRKRAQLFIADVAKSFSEGPLGTIANIDKLTAAADYKLPWILRRLGILRYDHTLAEKVNNRILIARGSDEEVEIRANTIWAVEYLTHRLRDRLPNLRATDVNDFLWLMSQAHTQRDEPYHLCDTTAY